MRGFIDPGRLAELRAQTTQMASDIIRNKTERIIGVLNPRTEVEEEAIRHAVEMAVHDLNTRSAEFRRGR